MSHYRPTLLKRSDSISSRWLEEQAKLVESPVPSRQGTVLPPAAHARSPAPTAAQIAALKSKYPDLDPEELNELVDQFHTISSNDGRISQSAAITAVQNKENAAYNRARETMKTVRSDATHKLEMEDWIEFATRFRADSAPAMEPGKRTGTFKMRGADDDTSHTFDDNERVLYTVFINSTLASDPDVSGRLPLPTDTLQIFDECRDGIIICKLIDHLFPGVIDSVMGIRRRKGTTYINLPTAHHHLNRFQIAENNNIAILAAKAIGVNVVNMSGQDLSEGREHLILSLIGQIIRQGTSDAPRPAPEPAPKLQQHSRSGTPVDRRASTPAERRASTPMKPTHTLGSLPRMGRGRSMSVDTDDMTRVPSPVGYHRTGSHERMNSSHLKTLQARGTFKLFEDLKSGIIILETLDKLSPTTPVPMAESNRRPSTPTRRPSTPSRRPSTPTIPSSVSKARPVTPTSKARPVTPTSKARPVTPTFRKSDAPTYKPAVRPIVTKELPVNVGKPKQETSEKDDSFAAHKRAVLHSLKMRA